MRRLVFAILTIVAVSIPAQGAEYPLITNEFRIEASSRVAEDLPTGEFPPARRWRSVNLTPLIADDKELSLGDTLALNLFPDKVYTACIDRVATNINSTVAICGRIDGYPLGYVIASTTAGRSLISIHIPERGEQYIIQSEPHNKIHYLLDVNVDQLEELEDGPTPIPPPPTPQEAAEMEMLTATLAGGPLDPANIDVMVVYTPAARQWADSSGGGMANVISQAMEKAQLALDNSNTILTMNLAYSAEVSYAESGSSDTDLYRLTYYAGFDPYNLDPNGYMDDVHTWRDEYGADLVALFAVVDGVGGLGWLLNTTSGEPDYGFSLTRVQQASWTYTHIHEMGHNMGCHHRKDQATEPGPGLFSYSAGWHWIGNDSGKYCSVMSNEDGGYSTVAYFSNPSILYQGVATGDATDGDNARTIRETKQVVAAYRTPTGSLNVTISPQGAIDAGAKWRRVGTSTWRNSGYTENGIPAGSCTVEFKSITGWDTPANQSVTINNGQTTNASGTYARRQVGSLKVTISPQGVIDAGAKWRRVGTTTWYNSDDTESGIPVSSCTIEFKSVTGWDTPPNQTVTINNGQTTNTTGTYVRQVGSLKVTISPQGAIDAGAKWRRVGTTTWYNSDDTESGIPVGSCTVEFESITGWDTPANQSVTINNGQTTNASGTYTLQVGSLKVTVGPQGAIYTGAKWRREETTTWYNSGYTESSIPVGSYIVEFESVAGWDTPANQSVTINKGQTTNASGTYTRQLLVTKCTAKAGTKDNSDAISFSGTINAATYDIWAVSSLEVTIDSNDMVSPCIKTFPVDIIKTFKKGKFKCSASNASFSLDTKTTKFSFTARNVDLSGLACPVTFQIKIGDSFGTADVNEAIVNGTKKPIPIKLMMGVKNVLRVEKPYDKFQVTRGKKKPNTDQLSVRGGFAVEYPDVNMANRVSEGLVVTLGTQQFTIPANELKAGKDKFTCSKADVTEGGIASATFNFTTCSFTITIKNTEIAAGSGAANFSVEFADFSESVPVVLP